MHCMNIHIPNNPEVTAVRLVDLTVAHAALVKRAHPVSFCNISSDLLPGCFDLTFANCCRYDLVNSECYILTLG